MYTVGQIASKFSVSRSTLLYYDTIGLLTPSGRSEANYRLYSDRDIARMEKIVMFRGAGLSLNAIMSLLDKEDDELHGTLERRLLDTNREIQALRNQQQVILSILGSDNALLNTRVITKEKWVALLRAAGLDEDGMLKWHMEFERTSPEAHQDFLESIGIDEEEIASIRHASKQAISHS